MAALNVARSLGCFCLNRGQNRNLALVCTAGTCPAMTFTLRLAATVLSLSTVGRPCAIALCVQTMCRNSQERRASASRPCVCNSDEEPTRTVLALPPAMRQVRLLGHSRWSPPDVVVARRLLLLDVLVTDARWCWWACAALFVHVPRCRPGFRADSALSWQGFTAAGHAIIQGAACPDLHRKGGR